MKINDANIVDVNIILSWKIIFLLSFCSNHCLLGLTFYKIYFHEKRKESANPFLS